MRDWYCPICGGRLSYGVYCKTCKVEPGFEFRLEDADLQAAVNVLRSLPLPYVPGNFDD